MPTMERHAEEMMRQRRELVASEARVNRACSTLGIDEAREKCQQEFDRQEAIRREATESTAEQFEKG
jgi:hypothetical protein